MGPSSGTYLAVAASAGTRKEIADEVWAINAMGDVIHHDLLFHMDDCKLQETRAEVDPDGCVAGMVKWLKSHPKFITSKAYPDYPGAIEFPLEEVINRFGTTYFNNTVAYAVAYAIYIGVEEIMLYGVDFTYSDHHKAEMGRGCVEYWIGVANANRIHVAVASNSTLLDSNVPQENKPYGYDAYHVSYEIKDGVKVIKKDKPLPTPEEIESRYNRSEHVKG